MKSPFSTASAWVIPNTFSGMRFQTSDIRSSRAVTQQRTSASLEDAPLPCSSCSSRSSASSAPSPAIISVETELPRPEAALAAVRTVTSPRQSPPPTRSKQASVPPSESRTVKFTPEGRTALLEQYRWPTPFSVDRPNGNSGCKYPGEKRKLAPASSGSSSATLGSKGETSFHSTVTEQMLTSV